MSLTETVEKKTGYRFSDTDLLLEAITHPSYAHEHGTKSNQRLEYLGDAVLGYIVAEELFRRFPDAAEGALTKMRINAVSEAPLAAAAKKAGLHGCLRIKANAASDSAAADAFEAFVAAVYLDGGAERAREFALRFLGDTLDSLRGAELSDFKSRLYEKYAGSDVRFEVESATGPAHRPEFTVALYIDGRFAARATAGSKKKAEQQCAGEVLRGNGA